MYFSKTNLFHHYWLIPWKNGRRNRQDIGKTPMENEGKLKGF